MKDTTIEERIEKSLVYIEELYKERDILRDGRHEGKSRKELSEILKKTKIDINYVLGSVPTKKILRYMELREPPFEFDGTYEEKKRLEKRDKELGKFLKHRFKFEVHSKMYELMEECKPVYTPKELKSFIPGLESVFDEFLDYISYIKLDPLKMIYHVWHKAFRKKQYGDLKELEKRLREYKVKTMGTEKEYLFDNLNDETDFDSLRKKSLYGLKSFYYDLSEFIYMKSFVNKKTQLEILVEETLRTWPNDWKVPSYLIVEQIVESPKLQYKLIQLFKKYSHDSIDFVDEELEKIQDELFRLFGQSS